MTIFVSIVSYRDPQLQDTLKSAVENAYNTNDLRFGIVNQDIMSNKVDYSFLPSYSLITIHPKFARGVGYARSKAMSLYSEEDYYLQVDSHTQFEKNWDIKSIEQLKMAQSISNNKKIILSSYPAPYSIERNGEIFIHTKSTEEHPVEPTKQRLWLRHDDQWSALRESFEGDYSLPKISNTILGGFIFAEGNIVKEIPYDPEISFFGEEVCFAIRAWTRGWDIYSPSVNIVYHFYKRNGYKKIWSDEVVRPENWEQLQAISKIKQENVLRGIEKGTYGVGNIRSIKEYEVITGYDFNLIYDRLTKK